MGVIVKLLLAALVVMLVYSWIRRSLVAGTRMGASEARALLDLPVGADADEIRAAHRKVIARVHPDAGGTQALATKVNAARDILLAELKRRA